MVAGWKNLRSPSRKPTKRAKNTIITTKMTVIQTSPEVLGQVVSGNTVMHVKNKSNPELNIYSTHGPKKLAII